MSTSRPPIGSAGWIDITVPDADSLRDFYAEVVGWRPEPVDMGEYSDYNMIQPGDGTPAAGVCHRREINESVPKGWMVYFVVADMDASMKACVDRGGRVVSGPTGSTGTDRICFIEDPTGAVAALYQPKA